MLPKDLVIKIPGCADRVVTHVAGCPVHQPAWYRNEAGDEVQLFCGEKSSHIQIVVQDGDQEDGQVIDWSKGVTLRAK